MMRLLSFFGAGWFIYGALALGSYTAGAASAYMALDAIYDFSGGRQLKKAVRHGEKTEDELDEKEKAALEELERQKRLNDALRKSGDGNNAVCVDHNDKWLRGFLKRNGRAAKNQ